VSAARGNLVGVSGAPSGWRQYDSRGVAVVGTLDTAQRAKRKLGEGGLVECELEGDNLVKSFPARPDFTELLDKMVGKDAPRKVRAKAAAYLLERYLTES
jgi:hypothetical protein